MYLLNPPTLVVLHRLKPRERKNLCLRGHHLVKFDDIGPQKKYRENSRCCIEQLGRDTLSVVNLVVKQGSKKM
jgi:hypothetical protein